MRNTNLTICDATIHPGESANLALPLPEVYSCASLYMPIRVMHGKEEGPCLLVFSAVKGDELNGLQVINRLLDSPRLKQIRGTLIAIPVMNVLGLVAPTSIQMSDVAFEKSFPGSETGSFAERLAHVFTQEVLCKANACIELQTGSLNHDILPQIYCNLSNPEAKRLAQHFSAPVITDAAIHEHSLRATTEQLNIPLLVYQAGEAMRFNESAIALGISGIFHTMSAMGMLDEDTQTTTTFDSIFSQDQDWIRAECSGVMITEIELGQRIKKGQRIGRINDPFSADTAATIKAPQDGVVVGINRHPLIHEGQTIFKVASFIDNYRAGFALEAWGGAQDN